MCQELCAMKKHMTVLTTDVNMFLKNHGGNDLI